MDALLLLNVTPDWWFKVIDISVGLFVTLMILWFMTKELTKKDNIIKEKDKEINDLFVESKKELKEVLTLVVRLNDYMDNKDFGNKEKFEDLRRFLHSEFQRISTLIVQKENK